MIVGTGIDIVEVSRIRDKIASAAFRDRVFSVNEISYCERMADKAQHYAARFAAKEAFLKATGEGLALSYDLHEIEVISTESGKPVIILLGDLKRVANERGWTRIHVSLSHVQQMACAVVIIEQ